MAYIYYNGNPDGLNANDCVIRAISTVMGDSWEATMSDLAMMSLSMHRMPNDNALWGRYLSLNGFTRGVLPTNCPNCVTVRDFCKMFPYGKYVVATGYHVIAVIDGDYFDTTDTGSEVLSEFWRRRY